MRSKGILTLLLSYWVFVFWRLVVTGSWTKDCALVDVAQIWRWELLL